MNPKRKSVKVASSSILTKLPIDNPRAVEDVYTYTCMADHELQKLPSFNDDGTVKFYNVGDALLGKLSLIKFVETIKNQNNGHKSNKR